MPVAFDEDLPVLLHSNPGQYLFAASNSKMICFSFPQQPDASQGSKRREDQIEVGKWYLGDGLQRLSLHQNNTLKSSGSHRAVLLLSSAPS